MASDPIDPRLEESFVRLIGNINGILEGKVASDIPPNWLEQNFDIWAQRKGLNGD
jgi:hypothetical protein